MSLQEHYLFCLLFICASNGINRELYSNVYGNERHDGFFSFSNISLSFPLSLKWNRSDIQCNPSISAVFANGIYCCITNASAFPQNATIYALDVDTGKILWNSTVYKSKETVTIFNGLSYIPNNYISLVDDEYGYLYTINIKNGDIVQNISLNNSCTDNPCSMSAIVSSNKFNSSIVYESVWLNYSNAQGRLYTINLNNDTTLNYIKNNPNDGYAATPTICNDEIIIITDIVDSINAFNLSNNVQLLWNYTLNISGGIDLCAPVPVLCIPRIDGLFNVFFPLPNTTNKWLLLDGNTGKLLKTMNWNLGWSCYTLPTVHTNKMILIRNYYNLTTAYDISDINGNWKEIWSIQPHNNTYYDLSNAIIINDYLFMSNFAQFQLDVYQINNGTLIDTFEFPLYCGLSDVISVGLSNQNNKPMIIIKVTNYSDIMSEVSTYLVALTFSDK
eukprot:129856_1